MTLAGSILYDKKLGLSLIVFPYLWFVFLFIYLFILDYREKEVRKTSDVRENEMP